MFLGFRYILSPDLNQVPCTAGQYQPFVFTTNGNSQCVLSKSLCNASGQVLANNGSSSTDISCRCDYRHNYDYVIPPKDPCSCKPAEEDCSCYIRKCDDDKVMIAGKYQWSVWIHTEIALLLQFQWGNSKWICVCLETNLAVIEMNKKRCGECHIETILSNMFLTLSICPMGLVKILFTTKITCQLTNPTFT